MIKYAENCFCCLLHRGLDEKKVQGNAYVTQGIRETCVISAVTITLKKTKTTQLPAQVLEFYLFSCVV